MALIVEDGTGKPDADALVSRQFFTEYCARVGYDVSAYDEETEVDPAIRRGTAFVSGSFAWKGVRRRGRGQALAFPRVDMTDAEGYGVPHDEVPVEVKHAACEAAWHELSVGPLLPTVVLADRIKSEQIGPLKVEYAAVPNTADASRPVVPKVSQYVAGLVSRSSNALSGTAVRG